MRAVGAACLLAVALIICRAIGDAERRRLRETEEALALLRAIKAGITCGLLPLEEIYRSFDSPALSACGFLGILREGGDYGVAVRSSALPEEVRARLVSFGALLGRSGREREGELCDYYIAELETLLATVRQEGAVRLRSRRVATVTGTLMLVLLLL